MKRKRIDHATRLGPLGRLALLTTLRAAQRLDTVLHHVTGGRTDSPIAWLVMFRS